jgi:hypothetical protein
MSAQTLQALRAKRLPRAIMPVASRQAAAQSMPSAMQFAMRLTSG